jgi:hypothetical protein
MLLCNPCNHLEVVGIATRLALKLFVVTQAVNLVPVPDTIVDIGPVVVCHKKSPNHELKCSCPKLGLVGISHCPRLPTLACPESLQPHPRQLCDSSTDCTNARDEQGCHIELVDLPVPGLQGNCANAIAVTAKDDLVCYLSFTLGVAGGVLTLQDKRDCLGGLGVMLSPDTFEGHVGIYIIR